MCVYLIFKKRHCATDCKDNDTKFTVFDVCFCHLSLNHN